MAFRSGQKNGATAPITTTTMSCSPPQTAEPTRQRRAVRGLPASSHDAGTRSPTTRPSSGLVVMADATKTAPMSTVTRAGAIRKARSECRARETAARRTRVVMPMSSRPLIRRPRSWRKAMQPAVHNKARVRAPLMPHNARPVRKHAMGPNVASSRCGPAWRATLRTGTKKRKSLPKAPISQGVGKNWAGLAPPSALTASVGGARRCAGRRAGV
jgi:hypothetical protein